MTSERPGTGRSGSLKKTTRSPARQARTVAPHMASVPVTKVKCSNDPATVSTIATSIDTAST